MSVLNPLEVKEEIDFNAPIVKGDEKSSRFSTGIGNNDDADIIDVKDNGSAEGSCGKILRKSSKARNKKRKSSTVVEVSSSLLPSHVTLPKKKQKQKN